MKVKIFSMVMIVLFFTDCAKIQKGLFNGTDANGVQDTVAPVPGGSGTLTVTGLSGSALTLNWTGASDNGTQQPSLTYIVYQSLTPNIDTLANAEANGTMVTGPTASLTAFNVTSLTPSTTYYFNVVVKDAAGNKAAYTMVMTTTTSGVDTTPPVAGNSGIIMVSGVTANALTLDWAVGTDDTTIPAAIQYTVYQSALPNVDTVANAQANGTAIAGPTAALATLNVGSLAAAATYYFNVVAQDAAGNKTAYQMVSQTTSAAPDTTAPTTGAAGVITTSAITSSGMTLTWTQGTDDTTAPAALQYLAYVSLNMDVDTVANAEANGTPIGTYATAIGTVNATALTASTLYCFNVIVKDAAGNKAAYQMACDTTGVGGTSLTPDGPVYAIAQNGNILYIGGWFTSVGGQPRSNIAAIDLTTNQPTSWNPSADGGVVTLIVSGSTVYVGGYFTMIGGQTRSNIAAIETTTGLATSWDPDADNGVQTLAVSGSTVFAGGYFNNIGGQARNYIAALDATTGIATSWDPNADNVVQTLTMSGSTVYVGGQFYSIGGQGRSFIAALDATTGLATSWDPGANGYVQTLAMSGSTVFVGGQFNYIGGDSRAYIAELDTTTGLATSWAPDADNFVQTLAVSGSTVYAGGDFTITDAQWWRNHIAAFDATGSTTAWHPNADATVRSIFISGSTVYVGGDFNTIGGQSCPSFCAIDTAAYITAPLLLSAIPADGATNVAPCSDSPCTAKLVFVFDKSMSTNLNTNLTMKELYWGWDIPISTTSFTWSTTTVANDTLTANLSWYWFPENTQFSYSLDPSSLQDILGNAFSTTLIGTFTTTTANQAFAVADTGMTSCQNAITSQPCGDVNWPGEDGDYVDIPNARSFSGPTQHMTYTNDYTTTDNVTGLIWKTCSEGQSGGSCGMGGVGKSSWYNAINQCAILNTTNAGNGYAGIKTWRLPTMAELETLPNYVLLSPFVDMAYFPNTSVSDAYWSSTAPSGSGGSAGTFNFGTGASSYIGFVQLGSAYLLYVRCVASKPISIRNYTDNGDGTVTDTNTNLRWQKCSRGKNNDAICSGTATGSNWQTALQYCDTLTLGSFPNSSNWRLPSINELKSLVDRRQVNPAINTTYFPSTINSVYWSSSPTNFVGPPSYTDLNVAWNVSFTNGYSNSNPKTLNYYARCVATGP